MDGGPTENSNLNALIDKLGFTSLQKDLVSQSRVAKDTEINRSRTVSMIYMANRLDEIYDKLIASNERLSASNDKFAKAANWLAGALLIVAIIQAVIQIFFC